MPQLDDIRKLDGVIFLRRGLYRDGVFRFQMTLPYNYNGWNSHPRIVFTPPIFSPLIDPEVIFTCKNKATKLKLSEFFN